MLSEELVSDMTREELLAEIQKLKNEIEAMKEWANTNETGPLCSITKEEAYIVAAFIDQKLFDTIRNDGGWDTMYALRNLIHAYDKMCMASGYVGLTEP